MVYFNAYYAECERGLAGWLACASLKTVARPTTEIIHFNTKRSFHFRMMMTMMIITIAPVVGSTNGHYGM